MRDLFPSRIRKLDLERSLASYLARLRTLNQGQHTRCQKKKKTPVCFSVSSIALLHKSIRRQGYFPSSQLQVRQQHQSHSNTGCPNTSLMDACSRLSGHVQPPASRSRFPFIHCMMHSRACGELQA